MHKTFEKFKIKELADQIGEVLGQKGSPKYQTTSETAKLLCVTPRTIYNLRLNGLPYYKIGSHVLFLESEITDFVKKHGSTSPEVEINQPFNNRKKKQTMKLLKKSTLFEEKQITIVVIQRDKLANFLGVDDQTISTFIDSGFLHPIEELGGEYFHHSELGDFFKKLPPEFRFKSLNNKSIFETPNDIIVDPNLPWD